MAEQGKSLGNWLADVYSGAETVWTKVQEKARLEDARAREQANEQIEQERKLTDLALKRKSADNMPRYVLGGLGALVAIIALILFVKKK